MEKALHSSPVLSFSEYAAKNIFDKPKKEIPAKIRWAKIKKSKRKTQAIGIFTIIYNMEEECLKIKIQIII